MIGNHHPIPVAISVLIAILASYTALQLAGRVTAASGWVRRAWLASGSLAMGVGIWSMHFVAMLAFHLPVPIAYDIPLWLLSIVIAVGASLLALFIASRPRVSLPMLLAGAVVMGAAIAGMHYTGMAAVKIPGRIEYDPTLVALSVAIAVVCAFTALTLAIRFRDAQTRRAAWGMVGSGVIMGVAIAGLHYTAMAAAHFTYLPTVHVDHDANLVASRELIVSVVIGTVLILGLALLGALLDRHLRLRDAEAVALRESRRAMATLLGNLPGMAYRCRNDRDRTMEFASDGALELTGYAPDDLIGNATVSFGSLIHGADATPLWDEMQSALKERRRFLVSYRIRTGRGAERWVSEQGQGVFASDGALLALEGFITDITERKRSSEVHRQLATIVESTSDAIISKALNGMILTWNRGAESTYGYTSEEVLGGPVSLLLSPAQRQEEVELTARIERGEPAIHVETVRLHKNGDEINVALTLSPIRDSAGKIIAVSSISRNITERKQAERELRRARDAAEAANRAKSDFLASMSHELRTPLNSVIGFANVLRKNKAGNLRDQDLQYLDRISGSGKHLLRLINDVLDLSKIEAGKMEVEPVSISLPALVQETVAELQGSVRDGIVLRATAPQSELMIESDAQKLRQILINLVGNALKFTEHGDVTLAVEVDPVTRRASRIDVHDTGIGIPPERLASIFQPFEQAESGTARRFGGTGLGLAISASLCELLGYRLEVASTVGVGSTFSIIFAPGEPSQGTTRIGSNRSDVVAVQKRAGEPLLSAAWEMYEGKTVLVIDDDPQARLLLTEHLADFRCEVIAADSGEQGLRIARQQQPQLIILDLMMPGMNGWQVLQALRSDPTLRDVPVAIVSALAEHGQETAFGVLDLLPKPVERDQMARVLRRSLAAERRRVLVVDDEENARQLVCACLRDEPGIDIRTAANGLEAIAVLQSFAPDVLVLDLMMPELDGMGLLARLRDQFPHFTPSVIVVTAKDLSRVELRRLSEQTVAVLRKDGELDVELRSVLQQLWGGRLNEPIAVGTE